MKHIANVLIIPFLGLPLLAILQLVTNTDSEVTGEFLVPAAMLLALGIGVGRDVARRRNGGSLASDALWRPLSLVWGALILGVIAAAWFTNR